METNDTYPRGALEAPRHPLVIVPAAVPPLESARARLAIVAQPTSLRPLAARAVMRPPPS